MSNTDWNTAGDTCDVCKQRHYPGDEECDGLDSHTSAEVSEFLVFIHGAKDGEPSGSEVTAVDGFVNLDWLNGIFSDPVDAERGIEGWLFVDRAAKTVERLPLDCWRWWRIVPAWDDGRADIERVELSKRGCRE
jgi:hypothetical protein